MTKQDFLAKAYRSTVSNALGDAAKRIGDPDLINLSIGDPDFITPQEIIDSAFKCATDGHTNYTKPNGDPELIDAIAVFLREEYRSDVKPNEIMVTVGACHAMYVALCAILDEGDEVLVPDPYFTPYKDQVTMARGVFVSVPTDISTGFQLNFETLESLVTPKTKAILVNSPNNPTGAVYGRDVLEKLGAFALKHDLIVLSDEVYEALSYGQKHVSVLEIPTLRDRSIVFGSFSKSYAMTGWRIGYAVAPDYVISTMVQINESICFSAPSVSQRAALSALHKRKIVQPKLVNAFEERMSYGYRRIKSIQGLDVIAPKGGIYLFADIRKSNLSSTLFAQHLADEKKVLVLPGNVFGAYGEGYIRIAVTVGLDRLAIAFDRIEEFIRKEAGM